MEGLCSPPDHFRPLPDHSPTSPCQASRPLPTTSRPLPTTPPPTPCTPPPSPPPPPRQGVGGEGWGGGGEPTPPFPDWSEVVGSPEGVVADASKITARSASHCRPVRAAWEPLCKELGRNIGNQRTQLSKAVCIGISKQIKLFREMIRIHELRS